MTAAETLIAQGRAGLLTDQLSFKFGELDDDTRQVVATATPEQITTWGFRLVQGAPTLAHVLA